MRSPIVRIVGLGAVCVITGYFSSAALAEKPKPGDAAPQMAIETLLNAPSGAQATLEALRGKAIVLEFWATWCAPCVAAIPHMNELTDHFKDKPIVFISLTNEKQDKIAKFLKEKRAIHGWVGLDTDGSVMKSYGITGIPVTVLIDAQGKIADITYPTSVTQKTIEDLLAGKLEPSAPANAETGDAKPDPDRLSAAEPLFQLQIRPAANPDQGSGSSSGNGRFDLNGADVSRIMQFACGFPSYRTDSRLEPGRERFDVTARAPAGQEMKLRELLKQAACATFGVRARIERRAIDCYAVTAGGSTKLQPTAMEGGAYIGGGPNNTLVLTNQPVAALCDQISQMLKTVVLDETGLGAHFDITFHAPESVSATSLAAALQEQFGLELRPVKRELEFLVLDRASE